MKITFSALICLIIVYACRSKSTYNASQPKSTDIAMKKVVLPDSSTVYMNPAMLAAYSKNPSIIKTDGKPIPKMSGSGINYPELPIIENDNVLKFDDRKRTEFKITARGKDTSSVQVMVGEVEVISGTTRVRLKGGESYKGGRNNMRNKRKLSILKK